MPQSPEDDSVTFRDYWQRLPAANPGMNDQDAKITLTVTELRRILDRAHQDGRGAEDGAAILDDIFGHGFRRSP